MKVTKDVVSLPYVRRLLQEEEGIIYVAECDCDDFEIPVGYDLSHMVTYNEPRQLEHCIVEYAHLVLNDNQTVAKRWAGISSLAELRRLWSTED